MRPVYYNEIDKHACAWLAENMRRGLIPEGDIDDRSIELVQSGDVAGYAVCHFFAGIGGWAYAGRLAGIPDDRPWWSGSCPCQPFSVAGRRRGTADRRHLWPHLFRLIRACRPVAILGEQVAQRAGWDWFDGVRADLASAAYQVRGMGLCSCAVDAPDERQRIYWGAVADDVFPGRRKVSGSAPRDEAAHGREGWVGGEPDRGHVSVGHDERDRHGPLVNGARLRRGEGQPEPGVYGGWGAAAGADEWCGNGALADDASRRDDGQFFADGLLQQPVMRDGQHLAMGHGDGAGLSIREGIASNAREERAPAGGTDDAAERNGAMAYHDLAGLRGQPSTRQFQIDKQDHGPRSWYADAEWIDCHDGKKRRAKPGTPMLSPRLPGRIPLWRGFGGSINAQIAAQVVRTFFEAMDER